MRTQIVSVYLDHTAQTVLWTTWQRNCIKNMLILERTSCFNVRASSFVLTDFVKWLISGRFGGVEGERAGLQLKRKQRPAVSRCLLSWTLSFRGHIIYSTTEENMQEFSDDSTAPVRPLPSSPACSSSLRHVHVVFHETWKRCSKYIWNDATSYQLVEFMV